MFDSKIRKIISRAYEELKGLKGPDNSVSPLEYLSSGDILEEPFWKRYGLVRFFEGYRPDKREPVRVVEGVDVKKSTAAIPACCPALNG